MGQMTTLTYKENQKGEEAWEVGDSGHIFYTKQGKEEGWLQTDSNYNEKLVYKEGEWRESGELLLKEKEAFSFLSDYADLNDIDLLFTKGQPPLLKKITFKKLGLSFIPKKDQLECVEYPGFLFSRTEMPLFKGAFLLVNGSGETKVIVPPNALMAKKSLAFSSDNLSLQGLLSGAPPNFCYTLQGGELLGQTPEANLYLALLYRCQNDFRKAKKALEASETFEKNSALCWKIFDLLPTLTNKSPAAIAFDCLFTYRMHTHMTKWSKAGSDLKLDGRRKDEARKLYALYEKNKSLFKEKVYAIPDYLRLPSQAEDFFLGLGISTPSTAKMAEADERLQSIKYLIDKEKFDKGDDDKPYVNFSFGPEVSGEAHFSRIYYDKNQGNLKGITLDPPALRYLKTHYHELFKRALSTDEREIRALRADLFLLLHNDAEITDETNALLATLLYVLKNPQPFTECSVDTPSSCYDGVIRKCMKLERGLYKQGRPLTELKFFEEYEALPLAATEQKANPHFTVKAPLWKLTLPNMNFDLMAPLNGLYQMFCQTSHKTPPQESFPLKAEEMENATLMEKKILQNYEEGYLEYQTQKKELYNLQNPDGLKKQLTELKSSSETDLKEIEKELLKKANTIPETDVRALLLQTAQSGKQLSKIEMSDLFDALLNKKPSLLTEKNCFLTNTEELFQLLIKYCLTKSRISQANEALALLKDKLDPYLEQRAGMILAKKRTYDIEKYPEFLVYEYATGKILSSEQVEVLTWILEGKEGQSMDHLLLQFAAGGGKTAVIIPILARMFAARGYLPVIVNTNELYSIGIQDIPESLQACFKQRLEVLEREIEHTWTKEEFSDVLKKLQSWRGDKTLLIKAVTWHSINTAKKMAYVQKDFELAKAAEEVLAELKQHGVKLEDESHLNSDPLQQTIRSFGKRVKIPIQQQKLFLHFYDVLFEKTNFQTKDKEISEADLKTIQQALIDSLKENLLFANVDQAALFAYLNDSSKKRPAWLKEMKDEEMADLIVLAKAFIYTHITHIVHLQGFKNYGPSIHTGDLTGAPKHEGKDTTAHFSDTGLVMALTIQMTLEQGIPGAQVKKMLEQLKETHIKELLWTKGKITPSEKLFLSLLPEEERDLRLEDLSDKKIEELSSRVEIQKKPSMIKRYLLGFALPQIEMPTLKATSTPAEMHAGFARSVQFSATPGLKETYPIALTSCRFQHAFEAEVLHTLLQPKNNAHCLLQPFNDPLSFMKQISPDLNALIDRGALLCHELPSTVINAYLEVVKQDKEVLASYFEEGVMKAKFRGETFSIPGTKLLETMKNRGIKEDDVAIMLYLDLGKATGTDVTQNYKAKAGLTIGKEQIVTEVIQAAMRERLLLWNNAQTIVWIMQQGLSKQISTDFDLKKLFYWMVRNEAKAIKSKIVMRAYQGIHQIMEDHVW